MNEKSFSLFSLHQSSSQKFEYFICSIGGALFAYIGQTYTPVKITNWVDLMIPLALLCLSISVFLAYVVIKRNTNLIEENQRCHEIHEKIEIINENLEQFPDSTFTDRYTGEVYTKQTWPELRSKKSKIVNDMISSAKLHMEKTGKFSLFRDVFLFNGFVLILISKVFLPYKT